MNNEMYLIHKDDYIKHIDNQVVLYVMMKQLAINIKRLAPNRGSRLISDMAERYFTIADNMYKRLGIPKSYILFGGEEAFAELMENELIAPEDAGYYACDGERCCEMCGNCSTEDEYEEYEIDGWEETVNSINEAIRSFFGDNVTVNIVID